MSHSILATDALKTALALRDLSDSAQGPHAMQALLDEILAGLAGLWGCPVRVSRASPIVPVEDNYDRLYYPPGAAVRDARYTRYVNVNTVLRTQTTAMIPPLLCALAVAPVPEVLLACPGLVYRRDVIDRLHTGEPHQVDLWLIRTGNAPDEVDLSQMVEAVVRSGLPGLEHRTAPATHPYTTAGRQIDVRAGNEWIEVGECGLALPAVLAGCGLPVPAAGGLAMGLGLDRILMLRKGIDDIRLLRCLDPRIAGQMLDLAPYRAISRMPAVKRDLSLVLDEPTSPEELGDQVRSCLADLASWVESVAVMLETPCRDLTPPVVERLGIGPDQWNVLVRIVLRALDRTLTREECDRVRDTVYAALHRGSRWYWAARQAPE